MQTCTGARECVRASSKLAAVGTSTSQLRVDMFITRTLFCLFPTMRLRLSGCIEIVNHAYRLLARRRPTSRCSPRAHLPYFARRQVRAIESTIEANRERMSKAEEQYAMLNKCARALSHARTKGPARLGDRRRLIPT
eukprot:1377591-Pleurochrysis_carterae.AAC.1